MFGGKALKWSQRDQQKDGLVVLESLTLMKHTQQEARRDNFREAKLID